MGPIQAAEWVASGSFFYQDREYDETGFTGSEPALPIRYARVEVRDANRSGNPGILAVGSTDENGNYSIVVSDNKTRDIAMRALTTSDGVPDLNLEVTTILTPTVPYAVTSDTFPNHSPTSDLNVGAYTAVAGSGGEAFNIYDNAVFMMDYLAFLNGTRPDSTRLLTIEWQDPIGGSTSYYLGNDKIRIARVSAYNDTVVLHETGHYAIDNFSASHSPGGVHRLSNCNQDIRLAFDEGFATYFGQAVLRHFERVRPHLYVKTTGAPGPGNLDFYFNVEDEVPFTCDGSTSEVTVYSLIWDLVDGASTLDESPGLDEPWDAMVDTDSNIWNVMKNYIPTAANISLESFWDGWFIQSEGFATEFASVFDGHEVRYFHDDLEDNDTVEFAAALGTLGIPFHATYFKDQGNGAGTTDVDYFRFDGAVGKEYRIHTSNLLSDANTSLVLLGSDGITPIDANDDEAPGVKRSLIVFEPLVDGTYYIKSFHVPGYGFYGSYDIAITGGDAPIRGGELTKPILLSKPLNRREIVR